MSIFTKVWDWLKGAFSYIKQDADKVAISITEEVKALLSSGVVTFLATFIDTEFKTTLGQDVVNLLNKVVPKVLAVELAIQGLPDNPTADDLKAFSDAVVKAFTGLDPQGKTKLYTTLAAQVYGIIETEVNKHEPVTFAELVAAVEEAYQDYLADLADPDATADTDQ